MTDRELQKLGRRELLQLLLDQAKETEALRVEVAAANERAQEMNETFERLRERLNDKDARIFELQETYDRLRERLNDKDAKIQELEDTLRQEREGQMTGLGEAGSIAEAALRLTGIFEAAQRAADLYLEKVHQYAPLPGGEVVADVVTADAVWKESVPPPPPPPPPPPQQPPARGTVVDVEPKREPVPPERVDTQKRGLFGKKRKDNKGKFVLSFGWEQPE